MKKPLAVGAWCLYDAAITPFGAIIGTFVFARYFQSEVAENDVAGIAYWSQAIAFAGISIAVLSPILGAIADRTGRRLPWIGVFTALAVLGCGALWFVRPDPSFVTLAMVGVIIGTLSTELATVFYNSMLPALAPPNWTGRLSGWGWATGYLGSIGCLLLALFTFLESGGLFYELFGTEDAAHVRATALLSAVWMVALAVPMFLFTPDEPSTGVTIRTAIGQGLGSLVETVRQVRRFGNILRFLIASAIYRDGLNTLFTFGGLYAGAVFGMSLSELVIFAILLNVMAAFGAAALSFIDDWIGAKPTILISLGGLVLTGAPLLLVSDKTWFWGLAAVLGLFIGPAQAAGRSMLARLSPPDMVAEMFGLYNLTGKAVSFLGPLLFGLATEWFDSARAGMTTVLLFFIAGFGCMLLVRESAAEGPPSPGFHPESASGGTATVNPNRV